MEYLEEEPVDLILVDLIMPAMDGRELVERLRADMRWRDLPVVVVTGMTLDEEERKTLETKVSGILPKGFDLEDELKRVVEKLTTTRRR